MKSPAGQFMLSTQAKAHAEWSQTQRATAQADVMMKRQIGMENLRTQNDLSIEGVRQKNRIALAQERGDAGVDLLGAQPVQRNPAQGIPFGTDETQPAPMEEVAGTPLTGMSGLLPDISGRALSPLRAAQQATGVKPSRAQVFSAIAQEDRQMQQEAMSEKARATSEAAAAKRAEESEKRADVRMDVAAIKTELSTVERDIAAQRRAVNRVIEEQAKRGDLTEADHTTRAQMQSELAALGAERTRLTNLLKGESKNLSKEEAAAILKEAGGDKEKARALARERGFTL
jgi:hypothetical protein